MVASYVPITIIGLVPTFRGITGASVGRQVIGTARRLRGIKIERAVVIGCDPDYRTRSRIVAGGNPSMVCGRRR
jgi:hypothetical protein